MARQRTHGIASAVLLFGAGCGVIPLYTVSNERLDGYECPPTRASAAGMTDEVFVGVALSGGGARAANFAAATLLELKHLGLLDGVSALSSASGGSIIAAYYALHWNDPPRWGRQEIGELLSQYYESQWVARWFLPHNVIRYLLTDYGRTHMMASTLDSLLFHQARFRSLRRDGGAPGRAGPRLFINATKRSDGGVFTFTDEAFKSKLHSCLGNYKISEAVMASSALPGVFHDVNVEIYPSPDQPHARAFEHLYDGGVADNLAVLALRDAVLHQLEETQGRSPKKCLFFIVDAYPSLDNPKVQEDRTTRGSFDRMLDRNLIDSFGVLLTQQRELAFYKLGIRKSGDDGRPLEHTAFHEFQIQDVPCAAWHITFQSLRYFGRGYIPLPDPPPSPETRERMKKIGDFADHVETRYSLHSPESTDEREIQARLFEAACLLVWHNRPPLERTCDWLGRGPCAPPPEEPCPATAPSSL